MMTEEAAAGSSGRYLRGEGYLAMFPFRPGTSGRPVNRSGRERLPSLPRQVAGKSQAAHDRDEERRGLGDSAHVIDTDGGEVPVGGILLVREIDCG